MTLRDWCVQTRIPAAGVTFALASIGIILAGHPLLSIQTAAFAVLMLAIHLFGASMNNLLDYRVDIYNPYKSHFPLVKGSLTRDIVNRVTSFGLVVTFIYMIFFVTMTTSPLGPLWTTLTVLLAIVMTVCGLAYNVYSKTTPSAQLCLIFSFATMPLLAYMMFSRTYNFYMILIVIAIFWAVTYAALLGALKDAAYDPVNVARLLGCKVKPTGLSISLKTGIVALTLKALFLSSLLGIVMVSGGSVGVFFAGAFSIMFSTAMLFTTGTNREFWWKRAVVLELLCFIMAVLTLGHIMSMWTIIFLCVVPVVWFVIWNRITWGTLIAPRF